MNWSNEFWDSRNGADELHVLESLQPHKNLEKFTVAFYDGSKFPSWIGDPSFSTMVELNLGECDEALLRGDEVDLRSLATLELKKISRLNCLRIGFTRSLGALQELAIEDCGGLTCSWEEQGVPCNLKILRIYHCANLDKLPNGLQTLTCLEELQIRRCPNLELFADSGLPLMLRQLQVSNCKGLKWLPHNYSSCALESLDISYYCPSLVFTSLQYLHLRYYPNLRNQSAFTASHTL
ncbi:hypothetical protein PVL29_017461 [Vitis rotundifolia]|uniref:R13L1/DRL21-like LRR repeat region domain-containing protein n=1 Tax=Vitis rotundifolia TaxID=103349 RepID=A0AA39DKI8_VITRO|nr:hypothetical protein PVL29_017461 [Vitis rotundifolia]